MENTKQELNKKIEAIMKHTDEEFLQIVASGAHPSILNKVSVEYYGDMQALRNISNITAFDYETIIVSPYDQQYVKEIAKAISHSNLKLNPVIDGKNIKIHIPQITEEKRKEYVKTAKEVIEDSKIKVRNLRRDTNNKIKNNPSFSENEIEIYTNEIQKIIDAANKKLDDKYKIKELELLKV